MASRVETRPSSVPDQTCDTRAHAWKFIFDCQAKKNAAGVDSANGDDAKKGSLKHEVRAKASIHK